MTVCLGSSKKSVNAGAPQGSVLSTYVFNIATDDLEEDLPDNCFPDIDLTFLETIANENKDIQLQRKIDHLPGGVDGSIPSRGGYE